MAAESGILAGDVIFDVGGNTVKTPVEFYKALTEFQNRGRRVALARVKSNEATRFYRYSCRLIGCSDEPNRNLPNEKTFSKCLRGENACGVIEVDKIRRAAGCSRLSLRRSSCCLQSLCGAHGTIPTSKVTQGRMVHRDLLLLMRHRHRPPVRPEQQPGRRAEGIHRHRFQS